MKKFCSSGFFSGNRAMLAQIRALHLGRYRPIDWDALMKPELGNAHLYHLPEAKIIAFEHDRKLGESSVDYQQRSWSRLKEILEPNMMYIFCDKSVTKELMLYFGHIFSCITDDRGMVIPEAFVSKRRDPDRGKAKIVEYRFPNENGPIRYRQVFDSIFSSFEDELNHYHFATAIPGAPYVETGRKTLTAFPLSRAKVSVKDLIARAQKERNEKSEYVPFTGRSVSIETFSQLPIELQIDFNLDCLYSKSSVDAFYRGVGLLSMGEQFYPDAVFAFQRSIELSKTDSIMLADLFIWLCHHQISQIYRHWGHLEHAEGIKLQAISSLQMLLSSNRSDLNVQIPSMIALNRQFSPFLVESDKDFEPYISHYCRPQPKY